MLDPKQTFDYATTMIGHPYTKKYQDMIRGGVTRGVRSTKITVQNHSKRDLDIEIRENADDFGLRWGDWMSFPGGVPAGESATWEATETGVMTGCSGRLFFKVSGLDGIVSVSFENPYMGENSYGWQSLDETRFVKSGGKGNHAEVTFDFYVDEQDS